MNEYLRRHLGVKLFLSYLAIIVVGVVVLILASQFILPASFNHHMAGMGNGTMTLAPGASAGVGMNSNGAMSQLFIDFRASFNEVLTYAALAAMFVAVILSLFFSRGVIAPVQAMSLAAQRIAEGRYDERVQV